MDFKSKLKLGIKETPEMDSKKTKAVEDKSKDKSSNLNLKSVRVGVSIKLSQNYNSYEVRMEGEIDISDNNKQEQVDTLKKWVTDQVQEHIKVVMENA